MNPFNDKINKAVAEAAKKVMEQSMAEGYKEDKKEAPFAGPYRDSTKPKKDQFGNVIKNRAKNLAKQGMAGVHKEEVEQMDEAGSVHLVGKYKKDGVTHHLYGVTHHRFQDLKDGGYSYHLTKHVDGKHVMAKNYAGYSMPEAEADLAKRGFGKNLLKVTKEEVDQIDEISQATRMSYLDAVRKKHLRHDDDEWGDRVTKPPMGKSRLKMFNKQSNKALKVALKKEEVEQMAEGFVIHKGKHEPGMKSSLEGTHHGVNVKPVYTDKKEAQSHADKINAGRGYKPGDEKSSLYGGVLYQVSPAKSMKEEVEQMEEAAKWRSSSAAKPDPDHDWDRSSKSTGGMRATSDTRGDTGGEYNHSSLENRRKAQVASKGPNAGKTTKASNASLKGRIQGNLANKKSKPNLPEEVEQMDEGSRYNADGSPKNVGLKAAKKFGKEQDRKTTLHHFAKGAAKDDLSKFKKEEVEQMDELNKQTLGSYIKKSSHDVATKGALVRHFATKSRDERSKDNYVQSRKDDETANKLFNKSWKRRQGMAKAVDRLTKEEAEQIDELKKSTLASYIPKASKERGWAGIAAGGASEKSKEQKNQLRFMGKRQKGIERATARLAKEDAEQVAERLIGRQPNIDANKNGKIDAHDFKLLRSKTKKMNESYVLMEETTPALSASMKAILADAFHMYFKAHTFHWNVEGANFPEYHKFFGDIYEQLFDTIDPIAEEIRALGEYAPKSLDELKASTSISTESADTPAAMFSALLADNNKIISGLTSGYKIAEAAGEIGLSNFLQDKIDAHKKLGWMIKSTSKGV
jgi:starvation-inducible DNA-binding protein